MSNNDNKRVAWVRGAFSFAFLFFASVLFLLINIEEQTRWVSGKALTSQPRFWPAVTLGLTVFFSLIYLLTTMLSTIVSRSEFDGGKEWFQWIRAMEFALWFAAYSALVPVLGYLFATLLVCVSLSWRLGYRTRKQLLITLFSGFIIVLFFRVLLGIHIPGGALYRSLPQPLSNFMMNWF